MAPALPPVSLQSQRGLWQPPQGETQDPVSKFSRSASANVRWCWTAFQYADQINNKLRAMRLGRLGDRLKAQIRPLTHAAWLLGGSNKFALPPSRILNFRERTNATEPRRNLSSTRDSDYCDPPQRLSKESAGTVGCAPFIVLSLAGGGAALASCWGAGFGFTTAVCCGSLLGESFLGVYRLKGESFQLSKAAYLSAFGRLNGCGNCVRGPVTTYSADHRSNYCQG
jgi:hypothetical protein